MKRSFYILGGVFVLIIIVVIVSNGGEKKEENESVQFSQPQSIAEDQQKKVLGVLCGTDEECTSGYCVSGVCCNKACTEEHQQCNEQGKCVTPIVYTCVSRSCSDGSSCDDFCKNTGYISCGGNACWEQDPGYEKVKHLMQYSSENYCQCSGKLQGVKYEDDIPYGQCYSTGSCDYWCSWIDQSCLKAGCSCGEYKYN